SSQCGAGVVRYLSRWFHLARSGNVPSVHLDGRANRAEETIAGEWFHLSHHSAVRRQILSLVLARSVHHFVPSLEFEASHRCTAWRSSTGHRITKVLAVCTQAKLEATSGRMASRAM